MPSARTSSTSTRTGKDELVTGIVRRFERGNIIVDLGRAEAVLPVREQVPRETYRAGDRIAAYVLDVLASRRARRSSSPARSVNLLEKLFEMEVPEIYEGIVRHRGRGARAGRPREDRRLQPRPRTSTRWAPAWA